jgi:hypothetical protein
MQLRRNEILTGLLVLVTVAMLTGILIHPRRAGAV